MNPFMFCGDCIEQGNAMLKDYDERIEEKVKELKENIHHTLKILGVKIHDEDTFDLIGVNNAIYSVKAEIDEMFAFQDDGEKK